MSSWLKQVCELWNEQKINMETINVVTSGIVYYVPRNALSVETGSENNKENKQETSGMSNRSNCVQERMPCFVCCIQIGLYAIDRTLKSKKSEWADYAAVQA